MKTLKTILLILGIILLTAGVYKQDGIAIGANAAFNVISKSAGAPSWADINHARSWAVPAAIRTGLVLKLAGLGLLFALFFAKLHATAKREELSVTLPALLGLGSAVCFAVFAALAPVARTIAWTWEVIAMDIPFGLDADSLQQLRNAIYTEANFAISGALVLSVALFLLIAALVSCRRRMARLVAMPAAFPALFLLTQEGREIVVEEITWFGTIGRGGVFSVVASFVPLVFLVLFIWALTVRNKEPRTTSLLTILMATVTGCVGLFFWVSTMSHIAPFRSLPQSAEAFSYHEGLKILCRPLVMTWVLYVVLLASAIFIPILCAFSLRQPRKKSEKTEPAKKASLPLIAGVVAVIVFVVAGCLGFREDPYKESLREVSVYCGGEMPEEDVARIESQEGIKFLCETLHDPREYYWHQFIVEYLWRWSGNPKSREMVFDILFDSAHPIASAHAVSVILEDLGWDQEKETQEIILSHLSENPGRGRSIIQVALETGFLRSGFVFELMKTCADAGVDEFALLAKTPHFEASEIIVVPEGFTVYYHREPGPDARKFVVKLLWCKPDSFELSDNPRQGRTVLEAAGKRFDYVLNEFGEMMPDYKKLMHVLPEPKAEPEQVWVELHVSPLVYADHIRRVLNACAKAGITTVSIVEVQ